MDTRGGNKQTGGGDYSDSHKQINKNHFLYNQSSSELDKISKSAGHKLLLKKRINAGYMYPSSLEGQVNRTMTIARSSRVNDVGSSAPNIQDLSQIFQ
jgi:hypothetical protein